MKFGEISINGSVMRDPRKIESIRSIEKMEHVVNNY